jgi:hypothetical protein
LSLPLLARLSAFHCGSHVCLHIHFKFLIHPLYHCRFTA